MSRGGAQRSSVFDKGKLVECIIRDLDLERDWLRERLRDSFITDELVILRDAIALLVHRAETARRRLKWQKL